MLKRQVNEARWTLRLETRGPLLIKKGNAQAEPVQTFVGGVPRYYIPGSTLRGVVRSHLERIIRTLQVSRPNTNATSTPPTKEPSIVCNPFARVNDHGPWSEVSCSHKFAYRAEAAEQVSPGTGARVALRGPDFYAQACPVCRLFGSAYVASRVVFADAIASNAVSLEHRDGVGINRLTGGAQTETHSLFHIQAVGPGTVFDAEVTLRNFECWQLGALLLVMTDFADDLITIGSGRSRGLGLVHGSILDEALHLTTFGARPGPEPEKGSVSSTSLAPATVLGLGAYLSDDTSYGTQSDDVLTSATAPDPPQPAGLRTVTTYREEALAALRAAAVNAFVTGMDTWTVPVAMHEGPPGRVQGGS